MRTFVLFVCVAAAGCQGQERSGSPGDPPAAPAPAVAKAEPKPVPVKIRVLGVEASSTLAPVKRYAARKLFDGDPATAWVEGRKDDGVGEKVAIQLAGTFPVQRMLIRNGLQRAKVFKKNNRVKELELASDLEGIKPHLATLTDSMDSQTVDLPAGFRATVLTLTIRSVYKGSKWRDTPIAEIGFPEMEIEIPEPEPERVRPPFVGRWMMRGAEHFVLDVEANGRGYMETYANAHEGEPPEKKGVDCDAKSGGGFLSVKCDGGTRLKLRYEHDGDEPTLVEDKPSVFAWPLTLYPEQ